MHGQPCHPEVCLLPCLVQRFRLTHEPHTGLHIHIEVCRLVNSLTLSLSVQTHWLPEPPLMYQPGKNSSDVSFSHFHFFPNTKASSAPCSLFTGGSGRGGGECASGREPYTLTHNLTHCLPDAFPPSHRRDHNMYGKHNPGARSFIHSFTPHSSPGISLGRCSFTDPIPSPRTQTPLNTCSCLTCRAVGMRQILSKHDLWTLDVFC